MQFLIVACALLGVALGQYAGYGGYPGYTGNAGYPGYGGYAEYAGYTGYKAYPGIAGYKGYPAYPGLAGYPAVPVAPALPVAPFPVAPALPVAPGLPVAPVVKPVVPLTDVVKVVKPLPLPAPIVPIAPKAVYGGPYPAIRSQSQASSPDGTYSWQYQTEDGIYAAEAGGPKPGVNGPEEVVQGEYSYTAPNGQLIQVRYTADENGFHPQGIHIPGQAAAYSVDARALPVVPVPLIAAAPKAVATKK